MVKTKVPWTSSTGSEFIFEYEVKRTEASSVRSISGEIYHILAEKKSTAADEEREQKGASKRTRRKVQEAVGYIEGYTITRGSDGNKNFQEHADEVSGELSKFACALYDSRGMYCRAPRGSAITDIFHMDGSMFLIEVVEIKPQFSGIDLGINFIHECLSHIGHRIGVVVMYPWAVNSCVLRYKENEQRLKESIEGKNESEKIDLYRSNTVKLRQQYSRMGFRAIAATPDWVDKWFLSMHSYKTMEPEDIKSGWLSKEEASQLIVPMPVKEYAASAGDKELKQLLHGLKPDYDYYGDGGHYNSQLRAQMDSLQQSLASVADKLLGGAPFAPLQKIQDSLNQMTDLLPTNETSKLTNEKKIDVKRLVDAGASLNGINALHLAAANYKKEDLFDLLIDEYGMSVEAFDSIGRKPIHVAAVTENADAVRILIAKGADKTGLNEEGQTALQELNESQRNLGGFASMLGNASGDQDLYKIRRLLM
mmetsp:Transcript_20037/g.43434  ORF Transcript_20037/g.43434 Transcript_20037/m.43434 type:complete len:480 (+) Transcript_20037:133-1572(+)